MTLRDELANLLLGSGDFGALGRWLSRNGVRILAALEEAGASLESVIEECAKVADGFDDGAPTARAVTAKVIAAAIRALKPAGDE